MRSFRLRFAAFGAIVLTFATTANAGTTYYWYGADTTIGGAGTWNTTASYWSADSATYGAVVWPNTTDYDAWFAGTSGAVTLDGRNPWQFGEKELAAFRNQSIGFVFQDHCLLPQCSVLENVLLPTLAERRQSPAEAEDRARRHRAQTRSFPFRDLFAP